MSEQNERRCTCATANDPDCPMHGYGENEQLAPDMTQRIGDSLTNRATGMTPAEASWDSVCYCTPDEISPSCMVVRHRENWWHERVQHQEHELTALRLQVRDLERERDDYKLHFDSYNVLEQALYEARNKQAEQEHLLNVIRRQATYWENYAEAAQARVSELESKYPTVESHRMAVLAGEIANLRDAERTLNTRLVQAGAREQRLRDALEEIGSIPARAQGLTRRVEVEMQDVAHRALEDAGSQPQGAEG